MLIPLIIFFAIPLVSLVLIESLELKTPDYAYITGLSILGSSIFSLDKMDELRQSYTFRSLLYIPSIVFIFWGFFKFDWYLVIFSMWIGSYYLYLSRRIVWLKLYTNGKTGLENIIWDNLFIPVGVIVTLYGLLTK